MVAASVIEGLKHHWNVQRAVCPKPWTRGLKTPSSTLNPKPQPLNTKPRGVVLASGEDNHIPAGHDTGVKSSNVEACINGPKPQTLIIFLSSLYIHSNCMHYPWSPLLGM